MNSDTLFERRDQLKAEMDGLKAELKDVDEQISNLFLKPAQGALLSQGKDFGTTYLNLGNKKLKAVLRKKVTWDQEALRKALDEMPVDDARHYGKLTFSVEERKYNEAPPRVKELLEECRTVELGGVTFSVEN